jgi:hypothetical protein
MRAKVAAPRSARASAAVASARIMSSSSVDGKGVRPDVELGASRAAMSSVVTYVLIGCSSEWKQVRLCGVGRVDVLAVRGMP